MEEKVKKEIYREERNLLVVVLVHYLNKTYFKGDKNRAIHWMVSSNKNFNGASPKELILLGRATFLWNYVLNAEYERGEI